MIKAILIDDEPLARMILREYLASFLEITIVEECGDGFEGVKAIMQHDPDLIFLDIQMPKINGFEMLELIEDPPSVIFTTAFDEFAIKAFEAHAVDYLLKPFSKERFEKAIKKWFEKNKDNDAGSTAQLLEAVKEPEDTQRIVVKNGSTIKIIPVVDVYYLEAWDDYVKIFTKEGYEIKKKTLAFYEAALKTSGFLRVHRSFIVQLGQITKVEPYEKNNHIAILKSGAKIPLSRAGYLKLKETLDL